MLESAEGAAGQTRRRQDVMTSLSKAPRGAGVERAQASPRMAVGRCMTRLLIAWAEFRPRFGSTTRRLQWWRGPARGGPCIRFTSAMHRRFASTSMPARREVPKPRARSSGGCATDVLGAARTAGTGKRSRSSRHTPTRAVCRRCADGCAQPPVPTCSVLGSESTAKPAALSCPPYRGAPHPQVKINSVSIVSYGFSIGLYRI